MELRLGDPTPPLGKKIRQSEKTSFARAEARMREIQIEMGDPNNYHAFDPKEEPSNCQENYELRQRILERS